jgi:3-oxoacyl-[acyl-carrier-protein] synthase-3
MLADKEGMALDEYDKVVLHQGSLHIVKTLRRRLGLLEGVVPCELKNTGNTVSSSIPLILEGLMSDGLANNILISGFGVGLSWASMSLKRVK